MVWQARNRHSGRTETSACTCKSFASKVASRTSFLIELSRISWTSRLRLVRRAALTLALALQRAIFELLARGEASAVGGAVDQRQ